MNNTPWILNTYSIVCIDANTGALGSASASCALAVGGAIIYSRLGVGVVNTQHYANLKLGEMALQKINQGLHPSRALKAVLKEDSRANARQLLAIDTDNRKGAWTGTECIGEKTHIYGDNCVAAGNHLVSEKVVEIMVTTFERRSDVPLSERLLLTLEAAQSMGGDSRGKQSAAIKVMPASIKKAEDINCDLRVDDHSAPLTELRRIHEIFKQTYR